MRISVLAAVILSGCASMQAPGPPNRESSWTKRCYAAFDRDVTEIAGPAARDCGILPLNASLAAQSASKACAREAVASGGPFKFGYESYGVDSRFCSVAIRRPDGQLVSFYFDFDVTGHMGSGGGHAVVWTSKCAGIEFKPGTIGPGSFFAMQDCIEASEIFDGLSSQQ